MWDFIKYIGELLYTAFINPNNWFVVIFGWLSVMWTFISFVLPKWGKKMNESIIQWFKKYRILVLIILVITSLIISAYTIQVNDSYYELNRPQLILNVEDINYILDKENRTISLTIDFIIENSGNRTAYQVITRQCSAPLNMPYDIYAYPDLAETNPIYTSTPKIVTYNYTANYTISNNDQQVNPDITILVYTKLTYSDKLNNGNNYEEVFWFAYQSKYNSVISAMPEWKTAFEPYVNKFYK
jgi:hypothetical protein